MPAPSTPLLDDFNRADAGTLGANYGAGIVNSGWVSHAIATNRASNASAAFKSNYWLEPMGADQEAYCTVVSADIPRLICRLRNPGASSVSYYDMTMTSGSGLVFLNKTIAGARSQVGTNISASIAIGDQVAIQAQGPFLRAYHKPAAGAWTLLREEKDYDVDGIGFIGFASEFATLTQIDDFGGGSLPVRSVAVDYRQFPKCALSGKAHV